MVTKYTVFSSKSLLFVTYRKATATASTKPVYEPAPEAKAFIISGVGLY
jgi:hypothetical protein